MFLKIEQLYQKINQHLWFSLLLHLAIILGLIFLWLPVAEIFLDSFPPLGNDYYQFTSYMKSLDENFQLPPMAWRDEWFMGQALIYDHPWLHFYLAYPFVKMFGLISGSNIYSVIMLFLFFFFTYLATFQISKNKLLAGFLTATLFWINSLYIPLFSGGNTAFSSTLFFLPLLVFLIVKYNQTSKRKFFYLACFFQGLAFLAHPGVALFFVMFPAAALLFFYSDEKVKFLSWKKIRELLIFVVVSALIGGPTLFAILKLYFELVSFGKETGEGKEVLGTFKVMYKFINLGIFISLAFSFVGSIFSKRFFRKIQKFLPFLIIFAYIFTLEWLYLIGKNPLRGNILPNRTYWLISLTAVLSIAVFWPNIFNNIKDKKKKISQVAKTVILVFQILVIGTLGYLAFLQKSVQEFLEPSISYTESMRPFADAYPRDFVHEAVVKNDQEKYDLYLPNFLDTNSYDYRIHSLSPGFNIWWNIPYKPGLTHGYYDSRSRQEQDWAYWMDTAIAGELSYRFGQPQLASKNSALFLNDWFAIKYIEGKEVDYQTGDYILNSPDTVHNKTATKIASYLVEDAGLLEYNQVLGDIKNLERKETLEKKLGGKVPESIVEYLKHIERLSEYGIATDQDLRTRQDIKPMTEDEVREQLRKEGYAEFWVSMDFFQPQGYQLPVNFIVFKDEYVSPLVKLTNAPSCYIIGHKEGYNNFIRALGHLNYNSNYIIPVRGPESLSRVSEKELNKFDCVVLYFYKKTSAKNWERLKNFVESGGRLFIDTGGEVAESKKSRLPNVFPIQGTNRQSLGRFWEVTEKSDIFNEVDPQEFSNLEYETQPWNLSYATSLREGAEVLLSQAGKSILVEKKIGQGKVIWSGLNFFYRINYYHNTEETKFFEIVLNNLLGLDKPSQIESTLERPSSEKLTVTGNMAKGAVFKENFDKGWKARFKTETNSGSLKVYAAGPDMMYVPLLDTKSKNISVSFRFIGSGMAWFLYVLSIVVVLLMITLFVFGDRFFKFSVKSIKAIPLTKKLSSWWEKDEE